jgi:hypothetical protein
MVEALCYKPEGFDEIIDLFSIYLILRAAVGAGVYSASTINEYRKKNIFLDSRARPVRKADNLTAIFQPIIYTMWDPQHLKPIGLHGLLQK